MGEDKVTITFVGDIVVQNTRTTPLLMTKVSELLDDADFLVCNFEASISTTGMMPIHKTGPHVYQHEDAVVYVKEAGFNVFGLANNHIYDYGDKALQNTLNHIADESHFTVGAGLSFEDIYKPLIIEKNGIKIAFIACGENGFGALESMTGAGYAWFRHSTFLDLVSQTKQQVDFLFVMVHCGVEEIEIPLPEIRFYYRDLVDAGANAIIGCHPHIMQGYEMYQECPIFYCLGNFFFELNGASLCKPTWFKSYGVTITISLDNKMGIKLIPFEFGKQVGLGSYDEFNEKMEYLNLLLTPELYERTLDESLASLWQERWQLYFKWAIAVSGSVNMNRITTFKDVLRTIKRFVLKKELYIDSNQLDYHFDRSFILHMLSIESTFWAMERYLKNNYKGLPRSYFEAKK
jgi:hypothetical protein